MPLIDYFIEKVNIIGGTWFKDACNKIICFLYHTIINHTTQLVLANHSYCSVFRPMGYQNRRVSTHSLLKVNDIRYREIRRLSALLREMTEMKKLTDLRHKKNKFSVQMPHVSNILCGSNASSNPSALSNICRSLVALKWPKSITGHIKSCFNITELKPYASGSNSQPSDLVKLQTRFTDIRASCCRVGSEILSNISGLHITSNLRTFLERSKYPYDSQCFNAMTKSVPPIHYFYYKDNKYFEHFHYVYNLMKDCISRLEKIQGRQEGTSFMSSEVIIKIGIAGYIHEDNLNLIPRTWKRDISRDQRIWNASPILFFQNDLSLKSALTILRQVNACHRILIRTDTVCGEAYEADDLNSITIVGQNKGQIRETIITCLEEPLHQMLQQWTDVLKSILSAKSLSEIVTEMNAIRKQLLCCSKKDTPTPFVLPRIGSQSLVPDDVKEYLFGMTDVTSFGIWGDSILKVFVQKNTNDEKFKNELMKVNKIFFENFDLEIVKGKMVEKKNLKIGDLVVPNIQNDNNGTYGTLGGFVTTNDESKVYALTCSHVFPIKNQAAYTNYPREEIGTCVFTTMEKSCDFAAIEVKESFLNKCDIVFRRDDYKRVNAKLYTENLSNLGFVYKIGATTNVTTGHILSSEFYDKCFDENSRKNMFLVHGIGNTFAAEGDSGSLVFARPRNVKQKHVDVVGMVFGNNITIYDDDGDNNNDADNTLRDDEHISICFRIHTALELFKENQGGEFEVRFKDDLSSASSPSSSDSDD